jgi:hypothetical protein
MIYRDCITGIPIEIVEGHKDVLGRSLNETTRVSKEKQFTFSTSEDHVTWTLFRYLQLESRLRSVLERVGIKFLAKTTTEPIMLLWGSPVAADDAEGVQVVQRLLTVSDKLSEARRRTEPDVILDFGSAGFVLIEVKHRSGNSIVKEDYPDWTRYLNANRSAFSSESKVRKTGLYELARNWRIAWEMADGAPFAVVNLGPATLFRGPHGETMKEFADGLNQNEFRGFHTVAWTEFLTNPATTPGWLKEYLRDRGVLPNLNEQPAPQ